MDTNTPNFDPSPTSQPASNSKRSGPKRPRQGEAGPSGPRKRPHVNVNLKSPMLNLNRSIFEPAESSTDWPRYLVVRSKDSRPASSLNIFQVAKALRGLGIVRPGMVSRPKSGDLLIKTSSKEDSSRLLAARIFGDIPVEVEPHFNLNRSRGVVKSRDLDGCSEADVVEGVPSVLAAKRVVRRGEK